MKLNKIVSIILILIFIMNLTVVASTNSSSKEIYTQWTGGTSRTGDGTLNSPYNMLDDAIKAAKSGDTIIIKSGAKGAYMNEKSGVNSKSLVIDKNLTIKSQGTNPETVSIRLPGIILNANLTLENVALDLPNRYHDHIFVNGYTLTLNDITTLSGGREIDIFGGSAYDKQKQLISGYDASFSQVTSKPGPQSTINIINNTNSLSRFGKVFAGSMNNESSIPVNINITGAQNKINLKGLYVSGADESISSSDHFLGPEPEAPKENPTKYPVHAKVDVKLNGYFPKVERKLQFDGAGADTVNLNLITSANGLFNTNINNISLLKLEGKVQPASLSWKEDRLSTIDLSNINSELDLTVLQNKNNLVVGSLLGGGKLRLSSDGLLTITNQSTNNTKVMIGGFGDSSTYIRVPSKSYIKTPTSDTGRFELLPSSSQVDDIIMVKNSNGEWNIVSKNGQPQLPTIIYDSLKFKENQPNDTITISKNGDITNYTYAELGFEIDPIPEDIFDFLGLDLRLYVDGTKVGKNSEEIWTYNGLNFWIGDNEDNYYLYVEKSEHSTQDTFNKQYNIKLELHQGDEGVLSDQVVLKINDTRNPAPEPKPEETDIKISFYKDDKELENQDRLTFLDIINIKVEPHNSFNISDLQLKVNDNTVNLDNLNIKVNKENMFKLGSNILKISYKGEDIKTINLEILKIKPSVTLKAAGKEGKEVTISAKVDADITDGTLKYTISNNGNTMVKEFSLTSNTAIHKLELPGEGNYNIEATYISANDMYDNSEPSNTLTINIQSTIVPVEKVEILNKDLTLDLKNYKIKQIEYKIYPEEASNKNVIFESSNKKYLEIDSKGNLKPKKVTLKNQPITVTIRTVSNDKTDSINITIIDTTDSSTGGGSTGGGSTGGGSTGGGSTGGGSTGGSSTGNQVTDSNSTGSKLTEDLINEELVTEDKINPTINKDKEDILLSTGAINSHHELSDIEEHWAGNQINKLQNYNIITGFPDNEFKPNLSIKRGDLFVMIERVLKLTVGIDTDVEIKYFKDLSNDKYYYNSANNLISMGIISGFSDNTVRPEQEVTREEIAVITKNVLDKIEITYPTNEKKEFKDSEEISKWAVNSIEINTRLGILSGYPDNTFKPKSKVTRAETAVIIERLLNITEKKLKNPLL